MNENNLNILKLQIDRPCFKTILSGEQKIEHRFVYPTNAKRYVVEEDTTDENGDPITIITPIQYDALYLINGRRKEAPRLTVEVVKAEFVILMDEEGNDLTFEEGETEYFVCQVWYHLGKVISTENVPENF